MSKKLESQESAADGRGAVRCGESIRAAAERFRVSLSTVVFWVQRGAANVWTAAIGSMANPAHRDVAVVHRSRSSYSNIRVSVRAIAIPVAAAPARFEPRP